MTNKPSITDYTESEFIEFIQEILLENTSRTHEKLDPLIEQFIKVVEHPSSTDLIYYSSEDDYTPEAITRIIKTWLTENGKPGFKEI